ncbi:MAG TPA: multifunctional CCA addition/repair protein [Steroidobacteraceae bacterium]|nr:multifunctional CCA addition/repair protein [Steroidobacteraceae bacterium]
MYLVGGAVRDRLLGRPVGERDWVVVGATPEELTAQGYTPVGKDFPVFLHPQTKEEYALARLERKVAPGYHGFTTEFSPQVTLEEDLKRRDLTINAMAEDAAGQIVDPYGGRRDLKSRLLRHVSEAFVEDPVRVLRVARFAARYADAGFRIASETIALMADMTANGEIAALTPERVWRESARALLEPRPQVFFEILQQCGALQVLMPELAALSGVPQPANWHPEVDTFVHIMLALSIAAERQASLAVRYAVLLHDLGKALTPKEHWPAHHRHEELGVAPIEHLSQRLRAPSECRELAVLTSLQHTLVHRALQLRPETLMKLFTETDAFRRPERFGELLLACECDARGREGLASRPYPQADYLREARAAAATAALDPKERQGLTGLQIGAALQQRRLAVVTQIRERFITENRADPGAGN